MAQLITVEDFFVLPRFLLKLVGVSSTHFNFELLTLNIGFRFYLSALHVTLFFIANLMYIVFAAFDLLVFSFNISSLGYTLIGVVKISPILLKRRAIDELKEQLFDILPRTRETQARMRQCLADSNKMAIYYVTIMALPATLFIVSPMAMSAHSYLTTGQWDAKHSFNGWFPFDSQKRGFFELVLLFEYLGATTAASFIFVADMYALAFVNQICTHFDMLREEFRQKQPSRQSVEEDMHFIERSVIRHNKIIKLSVELDHVFTVANCLNYLLSTAIICTIGFLVVFAGATNALIRYIPGVVACIYQIYIIGWMGDKIALSSMAVADGVYGGSWSDGHIRYQKSLLLIIQACQRHQKLTLYKFSVASHIAFTSTVGNSWKLLAVLRTLYGD